MPAALFRASPVPSKSISPESLATGEGVTRIPPSPSVSMPVNTTLKQWDYFLCSSGAERLLEIAGKDKPRRRGEGMGHSSCQGHLRVSSMPSPEGREHRHSEQGLGDPRAHGNPRWRPVHTQALCLLPEALANCKPSPAPWSGPPSLHPLECE